MKFALTLSLIALPMLSQAQKMEFSLDAGIAAQGLLINKNHVPTDKAYSKPDFNPVTSLKIGVVKKNMHQGFLMNYSRFSYLVDSRYLYHYFEPWLTVFSGYNKYMVADKAFLFQYYLEKSTHFRKFEFSYGGSLGNGKFYPFKPGATFPGYHIKDTYYDLSSRYVFTIAARLGAAYNFNQHFAASLSLVPSYLCTLTLDPEQYGHLYSISLNTGIRYTL